MVPGKAIKPVRKFSVISAAVISKMQAVRSCLSLITNRSSSNASCKQRFSVFGKYQDLSSSIRAERRSP